MNRSYPGVRYLFTALAVIFCLSFPAYAYEGDDMTDAETADGMTLMKVGNASVVMPKDGAVKKEGDLLIVEGPTEYAARKFVAVGKRLAEIDARLMALQKEVKDIKEGLAELKESKNALTSGR